MESCRLFCSGENKSLAVVTVRTFTSYVGKTDLPTGQIHHRSPEVNSSQSGFFLPTVKKFWEGHTTDIGSQGFHAHLNFWNVNSRRQDAQESSRSKRRFFLLSRCYFAR